MANCDNTIMKIGTRLTVENFSEIRYDSMVIGQKIYTPECIYQISFKKTLHHLYLEVFLTNKTNTKITIERTIAIFDYNNKNLHEGKNADAVSLEKDKTVAMIRIVTTEKIKNLINDVLIIELCVSIKEVATKKLNRLICDTDPERKLREDFKMMLENPVNSDVSLQVDNERIPAHWSILCSRSPYFKRMFNSGMKECVQNSVTITDSSPLSTVKKLIQFLYTADFMEDDDLKELYDLYYAADNEVIDLRTLCGNIIVLNATVDNACDILQLSHLHNDKALKRKAIDFIRSHSDAVFQTENWMKFDVCEPVIAEFISLCLKKKLTD